MTYGELLRSRRERKGLSLRKMADYLGVSASYLHDVELDRRNPLSPWNSKKACKRLGISALDEAKARARSAGFTLDAPESEEGIEAAALMSLAWEHMDDTDLKAIGDIARDVLRCMKISPTSPRK